MLQKLTGVTCCVSRDTKVAVPRRYPRQGGHRGAYQGDSITITVSNVTACHNCHDNVLATVTGLIRGQSPIIRDPTGHIECSISNSL